MNIFITGSTGFVGGYLIKALLGEGHKVRCLVREGSSESSILQLGGQVFRGDLSKISEVWLEDCDVIFHLAGNIFGNKWRDLYETNALATKNLYEMAVRSSVKKFIYLSSVAAVGPTRIPHAINEACVPKPKSQYGKSKFLGEKFIQLSRHHNTQTFIVRAPLIYGEGLNQESRLLTIIRKLKKGSFFWIGSGNNIISVCYVHNLINFLVHLLSAFPMTDSQPNIFHICDDAQLTLRGFVKDICNFLHLPFPQKTIPKQLALIFACIIELFKKDSIFCRERIIELTNNWNVDNGKAKRAGYIQYYSYEEALQTTLKKISAI